MKLLIYLSLLNLSLFSQELSLEQALRLLEQQNLEIKIANYDIQSADLSQDISSSYHYGKLNFTQNIMHSNDASNVFGFKLTSREASFNDFGFAEFGNIPMDAPIQGLNYPGKRNFFQSKLTYELPLYTGNKISAYENITKEMKHISLLNKQDKLNTKRYEIRKAYFDMALLQDSLKNLNLILSNIQQLESMTKEMIREGYAKKIDLLEVQSKKANLSRIIIEIKANKELLYHYLSFLLNQKVTNIQVPTYNLEEPRISEKQILENNIDIKKAMAALNIHENIVTSEESRYLPTLGAMAEAQTADDTFLGDASKHSSYTLGLQLQWNLFSGGADSAIIENSRVQSLKMQTQTHLAKKGISLKIKEIQTNIKQVNSEISNLSLELDLARQIYENYEGRYKEQLSSMSDVIIKQSSWLEKVLALLKAKNARNKHIFTLEKLGTLTSGDVL